MNLPAWSALPAGAHNHKTVHSGDRSAIDTALKAGRGVVYFDDYFDGATVNDKIAAMNTFHASRSANQPTPVVVFDAELRDHSQPIWLVSGAHLWSPGGPAREFGRKTTLRYTGASGTAQFIHPLDVDGGFVQPASQTYPNATACRDMNVDGIQFESQSSGRNWLPLHTVSDPTRGLWYVSFHDVGVKNFDRILHTTAQGCSFFTGTSHLAGYRDTAIILWAGAETTLFGFDEYSFMGTSDATFAASGKPSIRLPFMGKGYVGHCMLTNRGSSYHMSIEGGHAIHIKGTRFDAQTSDPVDGAGVKITGGRGIVFEGACFKGMMDDPANGGGGPTGTSGGATTNKGWVHATGGRQVVFDGCVFDLEGLSGGALTAAKSVPLLYCSSAVGASEYKWGMNAYAYWDGTAAVLQEATAGRIWELGDPLVDIVVAA